MKKLIAPLLITISVILLSSCGGGSTDATPRSLGKADAPVLIEEFSDIECPACGQISPQVETLAKNNPDTVRLVFYHFPLPYHEFAFTGAMASECAGEQGKFWEYLDMLYANQSSLSDDFFYSVAKSLNLDESAFKGCLDSGDLKGKITAQFNEGKARQIPGTPTIFINGQMVQWAGLEKMDAYVKGLAK